MPRDFLTEYRLEMSALLSLVFGLLSVIGVVGALYIDNNGDNVTFSLPSGVSFLNDLVQPFGTWVTWIGIIAPVSFVVSVWWLYDYVHKVRKLTGLMDTSSRAKFVRNMDDIEYLAWVLPRRFEKQVIEKKREFKL